MNSCTYLLLDPRKPGKWFMENIALEFEPFYVGKGLTYRPYQHTSERELKIKSPKSNKIKAILKKNLIPIVYIYKHDISDKEAIFYEIELIKLFGRLDKGTGILTNLTDGGDGHRGFKQSKEMITKRMANSPIPGSKKTQEVINKMVAGRLAKGGFKMSESAKIKLRQIKLSDDRKQHLREVRKLQIIPKEVYERVAKARYKKILQYNLEGNFIKEWESIKSAAEFFNKESSGIVEVLSNRQKSFAKYQWKYWEENYPLKIEKYSKKVRTKQKL